MPPVANHHGSNQSRLGTVPGTSFLLGEIEQSFALKESRSRNGENLVSVFRYDHFGLTQYAAASASLNPASETKRHASLTWLVAEQTATPPPRIYL